MSTPDEEWEAAFTRRSPALPNGNVDETDGPCSAVIPAPATPQVSTAQVEPAPEVLDGELISEAEYARRKGLHRLPVLAVMAVIRESDRTRKSLRP